MWNKEKRLINLIATFCICVSIFGLSIGYAALSDTILTINGIAEAEMYNGMFIATAEYLSSSNADTEASEIVEYVGTMFHSDVFLSETDVNSYITYELTIYNNSDFSRQFTGISYADEFYSNNDIKYELSGLKIGDHLHVGESITFSIRFYYDTTTISNNELDSYLNFNWDYYLEEEANYDILIEGTGPYEFPGVTADTPVDLANIANINFVIGNGNKDAITTVIVELVYTTTTGSKQSAKVDLFDSDGTLLSTSTAQFQGKQTNGTATVQFNNLSIMTGESLNVKMDIDSITNGRVSVSGVKISVAF